MSVAIPAPFRVEGGSGELRLRGTVAVEYQDDAISSLIRRFCREASRRTGLEFVSGRTDGEFNADAATGIRVELGANAELVTLPVTTGVSPLGDSIPDERYSLTIGPTGIHLVAPEPVGIARGLTTVIQLLATTETTEGALTLPEQHIFDVPQYAWRSFSLDVGRRFHSVAEVKQIIDLLALYKLNVLNLHLTEDAGWRLPFGRPVHAQDPADPDDPFYTAADLRELDTYCAERFVTLVPELDAPGHGRAIIQLRPELFSGRNQCDFESVPGRIHYSTWFDPELSTTFPFLEQVWGEMADLFTSPYLNIGADEPFGMPNELYVSFIRRAIPMVRSLGKRTMGWQESIRAGADADHLILYWITIPSEADLDELRDQGINPIILENVVHARSDIETAARYGVPMVVMPHHFTYLDVQYAEPSADPGQAADRVRLGMPHYPARSVATMLDWDPIAHLGPELANANVAGVGSAIWGESVKNLDDVFFLVMPRLAGNAEKGWSAPKPGDRTRHLAALAHHNKLWEDDGIAYFRSTEVKWNENAERQRK